MKRGPIREPIMTLVLTLLTCGVYYLYWIVATCNEVNDGLGRQEYNGGMEVVLSLLTCGWWTLWWDWRMANSIYELEQRWGVEPELEPAVMFITNFFGLGPLFYQRSMNNAWENGSPQGEQPPRLEADSASMGGGEAPGRPTEHPGGVDGTVEHHSDGETW